MTADDRKIVAVVRSVLARKDIVLDLSDADICNTPLSDLALDSIDRLDLAMAMEEAFDVLFTTSDVVKCDRVADIREEIQRARRHVTVTGQV